MNIEKVYFDMKDETPEGIYKKGKIIQEGLAGKKVVANGYQQGFSFCDEVYALLSQDEQISHVEFYSDGSANLFVCHDLGWKIENIGVIRIRA